MGIFVQDNGADGSSADGSGVGTPANDDLSGDINADMDMGADASLNNDLSQDVDGPPKEVWVSLRLT